MQQPSDIIIPHEELHLMVLMNHTSPDPESRWWRHELSHQFYDHQEAAEYVAEHYAGHPYYLVRVLWTPTVLNTSEVYT